MEVAWSSVMLVTYHNTVQCHVTEECNLASHCNKKISLTLATLTNNFTSDDNVIVTFTTDM